jgi:hypothetical protein
LIFFGNSYRISFLGLTTLGKRAPRSRAPRAFANSDEKRARTLLSGL